MPATPPTPASDSERLRLAVHAEIGQLLLVYQHLELMLKALLPHIHASEQAAREHADKDIDDLFSSQETMGLLVTKLKHSLKLADPEGFAEYLRRIAANRNELVHKFTLHDFGGLDSENKCSRALEYLKAQYEYALPLRGVLLSFLTTLMTAPDPTA